MSKNKKGIVWEDREVLFDLPYEYLKLRSGEKIFDRIEAIEDTKGNSGIKAIGLNCVISTSSKMVSSGLRGSTQALYVLATFRDNKYEFVFTNLAPNCIRHYTTVTTVHKAYVASRLYRDLRLRGAIVHNKQLRMLHLEQISLMESGVWNLSSESGNLGTMIVTNVRIVWYADVNEAFNVSLPYITIENVRYPFKISIRDSKFGNALVIHVRSTSGGYVLGFRVDPPNRLISLLSELQILHQAYTEKPIFGVEMNWNQEEPRHLSDDIEELEEIGEPRGEMGPSLYLASQLAQNKEGSNVQPVYSPYLGLAIEPLKEGFTLKSIFEVQTTS
ncbi:unnamed protein product [Leptosia nina]|uniref:BBSome complex member BBS5 PH domain-containing protein n=1 Tax=Leptosia nina TaxID=320188 RepID=A0AAV1JBP0_9NEOP